MTIKSPPPSRRLGQTIAIILVIVGILVLSLGGYLNSIMSTAIEPVLSMQQWITTRVAITRSLFGTPSDLVLLQQENLSLQNQLAELQSQVISLQQQVSDIQILSALLDFAQKQPNNEYKAATVVGRDPNPFLQYVIINLGSDDGIQRGMPVVNDQGLVGRISHVTSNAANVQLITDPASTVNIQIQPSDTEAVLTGSITGDLRIDLVPQNATIQPGDMLLTSGLGGNYPSDILIGQIVGVRKQATALFQQASVQPIVDFSRLEIILVIVNFKPVDFTPLLPSDEVIP